MLYLKAFCLLLNFTCEPLLFVLQGADNLLRVSKSPGDKLFPPPTGDRRIRVALQLPALLFRSAMCGRDRRSMLQYIRPSPEIKYLILSLELF